MKPSDLEVFLNGTSSVVPMRKMLRASRQVLPPFEDTQGFLFGHFTEES
jgi:hypothetical protein